MLGVRHTKLFQISCGFELGLARPAVCEQLLRQNGAVGAPARARRADRQLDFLLARAAHDVARRSGADAPGRPPAPAPSARPAYFGESGSHARLCRAPPGPSGVAGPVWWPPRGAVPGDHARDVERADDLASATEAHTVTQVQPDQGVVHQQQTFPQRRAQETQVADHRVFAQHRVAVLPGVAKPRPMPKRQAKAHQPPTPNPTQTNRLRRKPTAHISQAVKRTGKWWSIRVSRSCMALASRGWREHRAR